MGIPQGKRESANQTTAVSGAEFREKAYHERHLDN